MAAVLWKHLFFRGTIMQLFKSVFDQVLLKVLAKELNLQERIGIP